MKIYTDFNFNNRYDQVTEMIAFFMEKDGGRYWDWTSDPYNVNGFYGC